MISSFEQLLEMTSKHNCSISEIAIEEQVSDSEQSRESIVEQMNNTLDVMLLSIESGRMSQQKSTSGLTGGDAYKLHKRISEGKAITGNIISEAICMAIAVAETNASMGRIVAAPTAGSCGIIPGALGSLIKECGVSKDTATRALFTAGQIGLIIANNASISGAEGGCQAECGTASAMAAAAIVEALGGTAEMCIHAVAMSLKCILGLVCDPVAGLVEVPCIKRNASGVTLSFTAAEMALAGICSMIPADEVVQVMKRVGDTLPKSLRETAEGGLAASATGKRLQHDVFKKLSCIHTCACKK